MEYKQGEGAQVYLHPYVIAHGSATWTKWNSEFWDAENVRAKYKGLVEFFL